MDSAPETPSVVTAVVEMLCDSESGLDEDQACDDNVADGGVVGVHFDGVGASEGDTAVIHTLTQIVGGGC